MNNETEISGSTQENSAVEINWSKVGVFILKNPGTLLAWIFGVCMTSGAVQLFFYSVEYQVRFPVELSVLPTALFALGTVSFYVLITLSVMIFLPIFIARWEKDALKDEYTGFREIYTDPGAAWLVFIRYLVLHGFIIYIGYLLMLNQLLINELQIDFSGIFISVIILILALSLIAHWKCVKPTKVSIAKYLLSYLLVFVGAFWSFNVFYFLIQMANAFVDPTIQFSKNEELLAYVAVLGVGPFLLIAANYGFMRNGYRQTMPRLIGLPLMVVLLVHLYPASAALTARVGLNLLGIGGFKPMCYVLDQSELESKRDQTPTIPKLYFKVLGLGDDIYLSRQNMKFKHFSVKRSQVSYVESASRNEGGSFHCEPIVKY